MKIVHRLDVRDGRLVHDELAILGLEYKSLDGRHLFQLFEFLIPDYHILYLLTGNFK
jgi:hypothetical protein